MSRIVGRDDTHLKYRNLSESTRYVLDNTDPGYTIVEHLDCDEEGNDLYTYDIIEYHTTQRSGLSAEQVNEYFEDIVANDNWFFEDDLFDQPVPKNWDAIQQGLNEYKRKHLSMDTCDIWDTYWSSGLPGVPDPEMED